MRSFPVELRPRQSGVVLFVALIFLVLLTIMALTAFTISKGGQQIIGNMTSRNQAFQAAWQTSEAAISTDRVIKDPANALFDPATGTYGTTAAIDINGDGKTIINTQVSLPTCISGNKVPPLNITLPDDKKCFSGIDPKTHQVVYSCYDVVFQFVTTATDPVTNAAAAVTQGAAASHLDYPDALKTCVSSSGAEYL